ncbi:calcium/manganese antiporter SLC30A10-like [Rhopilema esculentum]|uniref:calcium/manganese antiporter SLC30A10-like n=1 Tax=Rhopilema esculentum TaxID=499914 RepID=UPI0031D3C2B5
MARACCSQKMSLITMIWLTTSFFFAEIVVGYATNSMALVADSFHMLSDVVSLFVGFFALKISQQDHRHNVDKNTFGWVRAEVLGALVNSVFLVALCFSILVESLKRIVTPEGIDQPLLVLAIGAAGLLINVLGIFIFQGHMGHGHSHGGHGHSHDQMKIDECHGTKGGHGSQSTELTTVVIVNKIVTDQDAVEVGDRNDIALEEHINNEIGGLSNNIIHTTPSRYKMGMMLAALQASEDGKEANTSATTATDVAVTEAESKPKKVNSSDQMNIKGVYLHVLGDALGSVIVVCSALAIYYGRGTWTLYIDPGMSIIMVAIILKSSVPLLKESSMILLQTVPTHIQINELEEKLLGKFPSIVEVHEFHVWQLAGSKIVASLHLKLLSRGDYMQICESLKTFFHEEGIHSTTIQPEFIEEIKPSAKEGLCLLKCESLQCKDSVCCKPKESAPRGESSTQDIIISLPKEQDTTANDEVSKI